MGVAILLRLTIIAQTRSEIKKQRKFEADNWHFGCCWFSSNVYVQIIRAITAKLGRKINDSKTEVKRVLPLFQMRVGTVEDRL
jgi:hypothetical protein